jgi:glycosyltransferase involved in cell wall biosynthesis
MNLSLVIPCYNEAKNLPLLIDRCNCVFAGRSDAEVVLVDNGSTDDSADVLARSLVGNSLIRSIRVPVNQGYGHGILEGLRSAKSEILAWTHADMQTDPGDGLRGFKLFKASDDPHRLFVKGRRIGRPMADAVFTVGMAAFETVLLRTPLWDINAQPTIFSRRFFEAWQNPPDDFSLDLYAYFMAKSEGLTTRRIAVTFATRAHGTSRWNISPAAKMKFIRRTLSYSFALVRRLEKP